MMKHLCHAKNCQTAVPPKIFMCKRHWFQLPKEMQNAVWREYRPGQEITKTPTAEYLKVTERAIGYLAAKEQEQAREDLADQLFKELFQVESNLVTRPCGCICDPQTGRHEFMCAHHEAYAEAETQLYSEFMRD